MQFIIKLLNEGAFNLNGCIFGKEITKSKRNYFVKVGGG